MKVWELMAELAKCNAGDDVQVCLDNTTYTAIKEVDLVEGDLVGIYGGDAQLVDGDGEAGEWLSTLAIDE